MEMKQLTLPDRIDKIEKDIEWLKETIKNRLLESDQEKEEQKNKDEKLSLFDGHISAIYAILRNFTEKSESIDKNLNNLTEKHALLDAQSLVNWKSLGQDVCEVKESISNLLQGLQRHHTYIENATVQSELALANVDSLRFGLENFKKNFSSSQDVQYFKDDVDKKFGFVYTNLESLKNSCDVSSTLSEMKSDIEGLKINHNILQMTLGNNFNAFGQRFENKINEFSDKVAKDMENLKSELYSSSPEAFKKDINTQLTNVKFDSDNAILISRNISQQIYMLEKKVDSALLQLKNIEINKAS